MGFSRPHPGREPWSPALQTDSLPSEPPGFYGHTIKKYNSFGDLVQVLGTPGKKGTGLNPLQFDNPAELHVDDTGDIYIVDGDGGLNNRLIKLSQDFMILWLRGENGTGPAKFNIPHSVTVDSTGRVWVADRGNKRLQVFDKDTGDWLGEWKNCFSEEGPSAVSKLLERWDLD